MLRLQLATFDDRRYTARFDLPAGSWSLASIERLANKSKRPESQMMSTLRKLLGTNAVPAGYRQPVDRSELKGEIGERIERERSVLERELLRESNAAAALERICQTEAGPGMETMAPAFSAEQLAEIESLSLKLRLPDVYVRNWRDQKEFVRRSAAETGPPEARPEPEPAAGPRLSPEAFIAGRAIAREAFLGLEVERATSCPQEFSEVQPFSQICGDGRRKR